MVSSHTAEALGKLSGLGTLQLPNITGTDTGCLSRGAFICRFPLVKCRWLYLHAVSGTDRRRSVKWLFQRTAQEIHELGIMSSCWYSWWWCGQYSVNYPCLNKKTVVHPSTSLILINIAGLMTQADTLYSRLRCFLQREVVSSQCPHRRVDHELQG